MSSSKLKRSEWLGQRDSLYVTQQEALRNNTLRQTPHPVELGRQSKVVPHSTTEAQRLGRHTLSGWGRQSQIEAPSTHAHHPKEAVSVRSTIQDGLSLREALFLGKE